MEQEKTDNISLKSRFVEIVITQIAVSLIIIFSVLIVKYFFRGTYNELKAWYKTNICADTNIEEVLK